MGIIAVFITFLAYTLHNYTHQDYQRLLIKSVDSFSDYTLTLSSDFKFERSFAPVLSVSGIELQSKTGKNYASIDKFRIQISLASLLDNTLLINDLLLENMRVAIFASDTPKSSSNLLSYLPIPIIEHAVLSKIQVRYENADPFLTIESLVIAAKDQLAPLEIHGNGKARGRAFAINGEFGPLADMFTDNKAYPVDLFINWEHMQLTLKGLLRDPEHENNLDLMAKIDSANIATLSTAIPIKGHFQGDFHLTGTVDKPKLADLKANLTDGQLMNLQISGSIANLFTQEHTNLNFSGFIDDNDILAKLLPDSELAFNHFDLAGDISKESKDYRLDNMTAHLSSEQGLNVTLMGNSDIIQDSQPLRHLDIHVKLDSQNTALVSPYLGNILPEIGAVKGSARITSKNEDFVLSDIELLAGVNQSIQLRAKGGVGQLAIGTHKDISLITLDLALHAEQSSKLAALFASTHPEIGPVTVTAQLNGSTHTLQLDDIQLRAGIQDTLSILADGKIRWEKLQTAQPQQTVDLDLQVKSPSMQNALRLYGESFPDLGPIESSMRVRGNGSTLTGTDLVARIGTAESLLLTLDGSIAHISVSRFFHQGIELSGTLTGKSTQYLSPLLAQQKISDIGPFNGKFLIKGDSNHLQLPQFSFAAGHANKLMLNAAGQIQNIPLRKPALPQGVQIELTATAPDSAGLSALTASDIPNFGAWSIEGLLTNHNDDFVIEDLVLNAGNPKQPDFSIHGTVDHLLSANGMQMHILFDEKVFLKLLNLRVPSELSGLKGSLLLANKSGSFDIKNLKIESEKSELIDIKVNGVINNVTKTHDMSLNADMHIRNPALFGKLFAIDLSAINSFSASGNISGNKNKITFSGNSFVGKTKLMPNLSLSFMNGKPKVSGEITSPNLFLKDFGVMSQVLAKKPSSSVQQVKSVKTKLFTDKTIALQRLNQVDLDLQFRIYKISGIDYAIDKVNIDLLVENGNLKAHPVNFIFSGGKVSINTGISVEENPLWQLEVRGESIQLGKLFAEQGVTPLSGKLNFIADLEAVGKSAHEIVSNMNGEIGLTLENGEVERRKMELVFLNPLGWLFSYGFDNNEIEISCGLAQYQIKQGIIKSQIFIIDGPKLLTTGKSEINLPEETVNSRYHLQKKNIFNNTLMPSFLDNDVAIKIVGNLLNPSIEEVPLTSASAAADRYVFAPVVVIPREILGSVFDIIDTEKATQSPCSAYLKR